MLDHVLLELVSVVREAVEDSMLEQSDLDERMLIDVWGGDIDYEASYTIPGEPEPPRVRADLSFAWSTFSQSAYRSWWMGQPLQDPPGVEMGVSFRLQMLDAAPDFDGALELFPEQATVGEVLTFERAGLLHSSFHEPQLGHVHHALEVPYRAELMLSEELLADPLALKAAIDPLGRWLASSLVGLADRYLQH
ncbi:MAG: hypothetical protein M0000_00435 [Actinomycetota bacterium]|nr:hypothetical protein [Actinomycetota bacterium]MDA8209433.1 hypothetical protein [Actinomycetota bacterium]